MQVLLQCIVSGILLGGLYAIIGIGLSIVFGIMKLTNIAHGTLMILSSFFIMVIVNNYIPNVFLAILVAIVLMVIVAFLFQKFLVNAVIDKGDEPALLVTFGVSICVQNILEIFFASNPQSLSSTNKFAGGNIIETKLFSVPGSYFIDFVVAVIVIIALALIMKKTDIGRAIRATSDNKRAAELMGVNTKVMFVVTMGIAMATATIAGYLVGSTFVFYSYSGSGYLIIAFGVVVIGGMGSLFGTLIGGILLGLVQLLGANFFGTGWQALTGYVFMLIILAVLPNGILGSSKRS